MIWDHYPCQWWWLFLWEQLSAQTEQHFCHLGHQVQWLITCYIIALNKENASRTRYCIWNVSVMTWRCGVSIGQFDQDRCWQNPSPNPNPNPPGPPCDFKWSTSRRETLNISILRRRCSHEEAKGCHGHQQKDTREIVEPLFSPRQTVRTRAKQTSSAHIETGFTFWKLLRTSLLKNFLSEKSIEIQYTYKRPNNAWLELVGWNQQLQLDYSSILQSADWKLETVYRRESVASIKR